MAESKPAMTGEQLRKLLDKAGVSQLELSRRLGVSGQTVHRWCAGTHSISAPVAVAIRFALSK